MSAQDEINKCLRAVLEKPSLATARQLEQALRSAGFRREVFGGRLNQKSSIEAASGSDRGAIERIANAFDATLTSARRLAGISRSERSLTPRKAAQRFLSPDPQGCVWQPQFGELTCTMPSVQFWSEPVNERHRFKRYSPEASLCTFLVQDNALGLSRHEIPDTILRLNSDSKLRTFEAIGQFGHGGSSALAFCESCLVVTQPRLDGNPNEFYWTLIFPDQESGDSKQAYTLKWFAAADGLPMLGTRLDFPDLFNSLPGVLLWHFGYDRGDWIRTSVRTHQDSPAGRLGRLFFSYPLPFQIHGEFARGESESGTRTIKGAFFRLTEDRTSGKSITEYRTGEKSEKLIVEGEGYGDFSMFAFVLTPEADVRNYVDPSHPVILTLHGQNHGELTRTLIIDAGFPELASKMIVEIRIDNLDGEALSNIVNNSREMPKNTPFSRALKQRVVELLREDEALMSIERRRQEERARRSSRDLNDKMTQYLSSITSDARAEPGAERGADSPGGGGGGNSPMPRPVIAASDPPTLVSFLAETTLYVPEGSAIFCKFKSDARPPKYSFHGDNPRCFVRLQITQEFSERLFIGGKQDINAHGYGSVTLVARESETDPITEKKDVGKLILVIQSADGRSLQAELNIGLRRKPVTVQRRKRQSVKLDIRFCAPSGADADELKQLLGEEDIQEFGESYLGRYREALGVTDAECTYWGEKADVDGQSKLIIEINAAHPQVKRLMKSCPTVENRIRAKERLVRDLVLDCYQHSFKIDSLQLAHDAVFDQDEKTRAAEICLNFDKATRIIAEESEKGSVSTRKERAAG